MISGINSLLRRLLPRLLQRSESRAPWPPGVEIEVIAGVKEVVEAAEVLITATTARESIVRGEWLRPGQHVTAVGADDNTKCGLDVLCLQRANRFTERTFERSSKTTI